MEIYSGKTFNPLNLKTDTTVLPWGIISSGNALSDSILNHSTVFVEIEINNSGPLSPRKQLKSAAYARMAGVAESIEGGSVNATEVQIGGSLVIDSSGFNGSEVLLLQTVEHRGNTHRFIGWG